MKKIIITYLISVYDKKENLNNFINYYKRFNAGTKHRLLICFKKKKKEDPIFKNPKLKLIKYIKHIDNSNFNDYDWGSYRRIAKIYKENIILFMNCHSYPLVKNWLKFFINHYKSKTLLGPCGSYESMVKSPINPIDEKNYFKSILYSISNFVDFSLFPNPHIRSNCFMLSAKDLLSLKKTKKYRFKKKSTWIDESGRSGMTNQLLKRNFDIFVVNRDNKKFDIKNFKESETYAYKNQFKLIISDKFTRQYAHADELKKSMIKKNVWG